MKLGFYVSNNATRLTKALYYMSGQRNYGSILKDIAFVYRDNTNIDHLNEICKQEKIDFYQEDSSHILKQKKGAIISDFLLDKMNCHSVDYLFVFGTQLLKGRILNLYKNRIINFHPSLLPAFQGIRAIDKAIEYGSFIIGNSAHFIDEGIDTGQIIMQNIFIADEFTDPDSILNNQIPMLIQIIYWLNENRISIQNRRVRIKDACYKLNYYIPNLEIEINLSSLNGRI